MQSPRGDCKLGNIEDSMHENFSQYGDRSSTFSAILLFVRIKVLHLMARNSKIKVDLKEKITERYLGEVYQGICRSVEQRLGVYAF